MHDFVKTLLARVGSTLSERTVHNLNAAINYAETGRWLASGGFRPRIRVKHDRKLFDLITRDVADSEVLYLEFGVFEGESMRCWASRLKNPKANLYGFDSFEGLPETWNIDMRKGYFSTNGEFPKICDRRVKFFKAWFEQTLPSYVAPPYQKLVVDMDADLYSSTAYVLA